MAVTRLPPPFDYNYGCLTAIFQNSPQLGILTFGLAVDRNIRIGVLPEREKVLIRRAGLVAGGGVFCGVERVSPSQAEAGQRSPGKIPYQSVVVDDLLKLRCAAVPSCSMR